jgi:demethylmenaquinone methyltransferase/2-methoxy-6-polyprenyl-1,4-benzoquinol methylase
VLEVAAGTGYWTAPIAAVAATVHATDATPGPLAVGATRDYPRHNVTFGIADAYDLAAVPGTYDAAFAGFWWSHIPHARIDAFVVGLNARLAPGSSVVFVDNRFVAGSSTPISRTTAEGNTMQQRTLPDGSTHEVLKNFPKPAALHAALSPYASATSVVELDYYWIATFRTAHITERP